MTENTEIFIIFEHLIMNEGDILEIFCLINYSWV